VGAWKVVDRRWVAAEFLERDSGQGWQAGRQRDANLPFEAPFFRQGKQGKKIRQPERQQSANLKIRHYEDQNGRSWGGLRR